jgi:uncharacterized protein
MFGRNVQLSPTDKRVELLDVLRGIAIFGMFTVNITADVFWADLYSELRPGSADFVSLVFVNLFTNGKFITIFSFLFGIGFYIQSERRIGVGASVTSFWLRRLSGLLMIGLVATACTLPARILVDYAFFGLGLLLLFKASPRSILVAAVSCFVIAKSYGSVVPTYWPSLEPVVPAVLDAIHETRELIQRDGGFLEIAALELLHVWEELTRWQYYLADLDILGLMLLGLYVGRRGAIQDRDLQVAIARSALPWLLGIGFFGCIGWVAMENFGLSDESSIHHSFVNSLMAWPIGMPTLGLGYVAAITLIVCNEKWGRRLSAFAPIGRTALTNYLFTGFVLAFISFQWGLGLYGTVLPAAGLLIVLGLLPAQMLASRWWLSKFNFGPFEWLWRSWTYGQLPTMRRQLESGSPSS